MEGHWIGRMCGGKGGQRVVVHLLPASFLQRLSVDALRRPDSENVRPSFARPAKTYRAPHAELARHTYTTPHAEGKQGPSPPFFRCGKPAKHSSRSADRDKCLLRPFDALF